MKTSIPSCRYERNSRYHVLRGAYENAFHRLAAESGALRALAVAAAVDHKHIERARERVAEATAVYRNRRDTLTEFLLRTEQ
jgi:hypothetical protein